MEYLVNPWEKGESESRGEEEFARDLRKDRRGHWSLVLLRCGATRY